MPRGSQACLEFTPCLTFVHALPDEVYEYDLADSLTQSGHVQCEGY